MQRVLQPTFGKQLWLLNLNMVRATPVTLLILCVVASSLQDEIVLSTRLGSIKGIEQNGYRAFKGIPYAYPPVGSLRFSPPVAVTQWTDTLDATQFGPVCPQTDDPDDNGIHFPMEEDCLYLNVWTPIPRDSDTKYPVMVYIHGGGWVAGHGSHPSYWGDFIANTTNIVYVSLNYRLGILGFMVTDQFSGNFGVMDQRMAMQWVKQYIADFNGDTSRITLFGQSAGGISVALHLSSPSLSGGTFTKAIVQSNPWNIKFRTIEQSIPYAREVAHFVGCEYGDTACLRSVNVSSILQAQDETFWIPLPLSTEDDLPWQPTVDYVNVLGQPYELISNGVYVNATVAMGTVLNETLGFIFGFYNKTVSWKEYFEIAAVWFGEYAAEVMKLYPCIEDDCREIMSVLGTDLFFVCPNRLAAVALANQNVPTYLYNFKFPPKIDPWNVDYYCNNEDCHSVELPFLFHSSEFMGWPWESDQEEGLSWDMLQTWTSFAHGTDLNAVWPPYKQSSDISLGIDIPFTILKNFKKKECDFWDMTGYDL